MQAVGAPTGQVSDPFEQLDDALATVRVLSRDIRDAMERGDVGAVERLAGQRRQASAEVTRLLVCADAALSSASGGGAR